MELIFNPFSITLIVSSLIMGGLSLFIAIRLKESTRWITLTMLFATIWGFFYGLELASSRMEQMLFWIKFEYLGISFFGVFWLIFTLKYTGHKSVNSLPPILLILLIPTITLILVWTNDIHHLHYTKTEVIASGPFPILKISKGPWYIVNTVYSYVVFFIGTMVLWKRFRFADSLYFNQTKFLIVAGLFPLIFNIFYQFEIIQPFGGIDLTPYAFLFTYLIISFAILRYNLFSIKPIAQNKIMEIITRGVLVFDAHYKLIDFNPAANFFLTKTPNSKLELLPNPFSGIEEMTFLNYFKMKNKIPSQSIMKEISKIQLFKSNPSLFWTKTPFSMECYCFLRTLPSR